MTKLTHIAALTGLIAALASPALANDDSTQALAQDSGRYVAEAGVTGTNAYVQAKPAHGRSQAIGAGHDVQLDGR
jgi:hypothetical protein